MTTLMDAKQCLKDHDLPGAEGICRALLESVPENAQAWHLLGVTQAEQGDLDQAIESFAEATKLDPENSWYPYNLALAYKLHGQLNRAIDYYRIAIDRQDDFLEARSNLGNALIESAQSLEAIECFRQLVDRFPDSADSHFNLANTLQEIGRHEESVKHYRLAIESDPSHNAARENLGRALTEAGQTDQAGQVWQSWIELDPSNDFPRHMLAAATGEGVPERCSDDYIRQEFDTTFANSFDRQLMRLDYQSPTLIGTALRSMDRPLENLNVLDAGCGTGLCGPIVRKMAANLVGVDLSDAMLVEARKRNVHDELIESEITGFMNSRQAAFDLIVSADTLCYFGDLAEVLTAAAGCLTKGGLLVFTVESGDRSELAADQIGPPYRLQPHGRYCHSERYVRQVLEQSGFAVHDITTAIQRNEGGHPVTGLTVTAVR